MDSSLTRTYHRFIVQMIYLNSRKNVQKNVQKLNYCFFDVLVAVALVGF